MSVLGVPGATEVVSAEGALRLEAFGACVSTTEPYEVSCRTGRNAEEFPGWMANSTLRLIIRAV